MIDPDLSDSQIDSICAGYKQNAAKVRFLKSLGLVVRLKPNGRPLVNRAHYDAKLGNASVSAGKPSNEPNWSKRA
jgi:hypothetical protein